MVLYASPKILPSRNKIFAADAFSTVAKDARLAASRVDHLIVQPVMCEIIKVSG